MHSSDVGTHISIPVGITVGLLASFIQSLGLTIQRKSHVQNQALPEECRKVEHRRPLWLLGFGIFISSNLFGSIFQIASLPVVILAPLGAVSLLWNAVFARILLGDAFSIWMALGTLLIAGGAVLIAVFGIVPEPTHSLEDLLVLFSRPAFIAYFSLLGIFTVLCLAITHLLEYNYQRKEGKIALPIESPPLSPLVAPTTAPSILTNAATANTTLDAAQPQTSERTPLLDRKPSRSSSPSSESTYIPYTTSSKTPVLLAMSYASFSGIISGMCLLFAKSGVELLVLTIGGDNQFWRWQAWVLVIGLGICALLQLWYMHKSLVLANPTLVCPLAFCFYNVSSIVNGLIYFDQFSLLSTTHLLLVMLGMTILLAGVWIVSFPPSGEFSIGLPAWGEPEPEVQLGDDEEIQIHEPYEDEPLPMVTQRYSQSREDAMRVSSPPPPSPPVHGNEGIGLGFVPSEPGRGRGVARGGYESPALRIDTASGGGSKVPRVHGRSQTDSILPPEPTSAPSPTHPRLSLSLSPSQPTHRRPRATSTIAPSSTSPHAHPHSHPYPHHASISGGIGGGTARHAYTLPPFAPLSPGTTPGTTLTGFSIGLSPMSPGWALVPTENGRRRRRVTGGGLVVGHSNSGTTNGGGSNGGRKGSVGSGEVSGPTGMRRVVSDGDVSNANMSPGADTEDWVRGDRDGDGDRDHEESDEQRGESDVEAQDQSRSRGRWKWVRGIFSIHR
ncbi:hypothetical protein K474DRAFT_1666969 [Panus rudis PR-1116 ss-1]|nr:hypothetical protein K474DRAFT_1666969 [Panus rudis PR-1116 ss-1]